MSQNVVNVIRTQYQAAHHRWLEATMQGVTPEQAHWQPPGGRVAPIGAQYAHHIIALDFLFLGFVRQQTPLALSSFAGRTGFDQPYPMEGDWIGWAHTVRIDLDVLRGYAHAAYAAVDEQLALLNDDDLATPIDMTPVGLGQQTLGSFLMNLLVLNAAAHTGEISVVKGLQGLQGYPF
ncbi:MAG TPA: DinB family protein [Anaerolineae bacterium]|nr:DinB family protein [Anaerolineae bacterium]HNU03269.1 DinB family protein [Anaerolineae bacterium]